MYKKYVQNVLSLMDHLLYQIECLKFRGTLHQSTVRSIEFYIDKSKIYRSFFGIVICFDEGYFCDGCLVRFPSNLYQYSTTVVS